MISLDKLLRMPTRELVRFARYLQWRGCAIALEESDAPRRVRLALAVQEAARGHRKEFWRVVDRVRVR